MKSSKNLAILVDDEQYVRESTCQTLELQNIDVVSFARANRAIAHITREFSGVVISDIRMPDMDGIELLKAIQNIDIEIPVILITGHGDIPQAVQATQLGAYDYIEKPFSPKHLTKIIKKANQLRQLALEKRNLQEDLAIGDPLELILLGRSTLMENLREKIQTLACSDINVLVSGETGTGKELVARTIHEQSNRSAGPFITVNLSAMPELSLESELFGHESGAFSGAIRARFGRLEHAKNGTLFLDKIESVPLNIQTKILRVIEQKSFWRLGSSERVPLEARIIASSNVGLEELVDRGEFRKDLLYRISVINLLIPPLRERKEDIPRLFQHLVSLSARTLSKECPSVDSKTLSALIAEEWSGNVRELRNAADRYVMGFSITPTEEEYSSKMTLADRLLQSEKSVIAQALTGNSGDLKKTYESLGISRKTLYEKMHRHNLNKDYFKD